MEKYSKILSFIFLFYSYELLRADGSIFVVITRFLRAFKALGGFIIPNIANITDFSSEKYIIGSF